MFDVTAYWLNNKYQKKGGGRGGGGDEEGDSLYFLPFGMIFIPERKNLKKAKCKHSTQHGNSSISLAWEWWKWGWGWGGRRTKRLCRYVLLSTVLSKWGWAEIEMASTTATLRDRCSHIQPAFKHASRHFHLPSSRDLWHNFLATTPPTTK